MAIDSVFSDSSRVLRRYLGEYQLVCGGACFVALFGPDVPDHRVLPSVFCTSCLREQSFFSTIGGSTGVYRGSARSNLVGQPPSTAPSSLRYRTRSAFPQTDTFWFSHVLWFLTRDAFPIRWKQVKDLKKCRELVVLERFDWAPLMALGMLCFFVGEWAQASYPSLETSGWQTLVWGFFISTTALYHATYTINSLAHRYGRRRFDTPDHSRNNFLLALLTLGEGWHNNHHRYPGAARQGFYWWEVDLSYMGLRVLKTLGLVWNLRPVPSKILEAGRARR